MPIFAMLNQKIDSRKNGDDCKFNGYLEDYLNLDETELDPVLREAFTAIQQNEPDTRICVGLRSEINRDAISNQIIRYKDIFKLEGKALTFPYILYASKDEAERALLVVPFTEYGFMIAKGLYYCMTEPGSEYIDCKNEIVAICSNDAEQIVRTFNDMFVQRAGSLQRSLDSAHYKNYDQLKEAALKAAESLKNEAFRVLGTLPERTERIRQYVIDWFLLKKVLYVQYMVNKNILNGVHEGNVKKQRNQAKLNADEVVFLSFSEMWRITAPQPEETEETDVPEEEAPAAEPEETEVFEVPAETEAESAE